MTDQEWFEQQKREIQALIAKKLKEIDEETSDLRAVINIFKKGA